VRDDEQDAPDRQSKVRPFEEPRKMTIPLFHVDAFTDRPFTGNPAAVCLLPSWKEAIMQRQGERKAGR
jgi:hypothetical protein